MAEPTLISWMPSWLHATDLERFEIKSADGSERWLCLRPRPASWSALEQGLRKAAEVLRGMPIASIVNSLDRVSARWCERRFEARVQALERVVAATGFSAEAVERSFDVELRNYRADSLWRTLRREFGDPRVLDEFVHNSDLAGRARAIGPHIALTIFTGNVPGLPALSIVRALLVKSAVLAKVASGEPTFAAAFARTLADEDARLSDALAITYWDRDDRATLDLALAHSDAVIAYGGEAAVRAVRQAIPDGRRFVEHGHKISVGLVSRAYRAQLGDPELARRIAVDVSTFNQHACIAPQSYLVEADADEAPGFVAEVSDALARYARECPLGELPQQDAAELQLRRAAHAWSAAVEGGVAGFRSAPGLDWTVSLRRELASDAGGGNRFLTVVPVASLQEALERLRPHGEHLQNVALGALGDELEATAERLALLGASRICEPGRMAEPSLMWRHDGRMCIADLVRWCDVEMHAQLDGPRPPSHARRTR